MRVKQENSASDIDLTKYKAVDASGALAGVTYVVRPQVGGWRGEGRALGGQGGGSPHARHPACPTLIRRMAHVHPTAPSWLMQVTGGAANPPNCSKLNDTLIVPCECAR